MLQQLEKQTTILDAKTEIEVNQLPIGAMTYDPLHPESWRDFIDNYLDANITIRFVFSSGQLLRRLFCLNFWISIMTWLPSFLALYFYLLGSKGIFIFFEAKVAKEF